MQTLIKMPLRTMMEAIKMTKTKIFFLSLNKIKTFLTMIKSRKKKRKKTKKTSRLSNRIILGMD